MRITLEDEYNIFFILQGLIIFINIQHFYILCTFMVQGFFFKRGRSCFFKCFFI